MLFFLFAACAHVPATWEVTPEAGVEIPEAAVAVVMSDGDCRGLAEALTRELNRRAAVRVDPTSDTRLALSNCDVDVRAEVELTQLYSGLGTGLTGSVEHRDEVVRAKGSVVLTVEINSRPSATFGAKAQRVRRLSSTQTRRTQGRISVVDGVTRDMAQQLAQRVAPEPELVHRRMYRNPDPGSARALHNRAVEAERTGDLGLALKMARRSLGAAPSTAAERYVRLLEQRLETSRLVEGRQP